MEQLHLWQHKCYNFKVFLWILALDNKNDTSINIAQTVRVHKTNTWTPQTGDIYLLLLYGDPEREYWIIKQGIMNK